jgi:phasin family protein
MYASPSQLIEMQKTQLDALQAVGSAVFEAAEKLAQLNVSASREALQDGAGVAQSLLSAKDPQELTAITGTLAQPGAEKFANYSRNVYAIASATSAELSKIVEAQIAEGNRKFAEFIDFAAKSAPAGSEHAFGMLKSSLSVANSAFDAVTKAARQAGETAESNIAAAVAVAADAVKGKAKKAA